MKRIMKGGGSNYKRWSIYRGADKSLARPTSPCILFDGKNITFDISLIYIYIYMYQTVLYIYTTYIVLIFLQLLL
jgi:hypothetical protein